MYEASGLRARIFLKVRTVYGASCGSDLSAQFQWFRSVCARYAIVHVLDQQSRKYQDYSALWHGRFSSESRLYRPQARMCYVLLICSVSSIAKWATGLPVSSGSPVNFEYLSRGVVNKLEKLTPIVASRWTV